MRPRASGRSGILLAAVVIVGAGVLAYSNTFSVPFIYDDLGDIVENPAVHGFRDAQKEPLSPGGVNLTSRPVADLTFAANYALDGLNVRGYHVVNLLIHVLGALALFGVVRRTLTSAGLRERFLPHATSLAFVVALLWLVHPLQTESVTYIVHRYESLLGLFFLLTLYAAIRGMESGKPGWFVASVLLSALGMATKERMVVAPVIVLLYDRAFFSGTFKEALRRRRSFYLGLAATWAVLAVVILRAAHVAGGFGFGMTVLEYARIQVPAVVHYLQQAFWPHPLVLHCGFSYENGRPILPGAAEVIPCLIILSVLLATTVIAVLRRPQWGIPAAWFFLLLAPTSSVIPNWEAVEEHHTYLPLAGVIVLAVVGVYLLWRTAVGRRVGFAVAILCVAALGAATYARNHDYRSAVSIWEDTVSKRPLSPRARLCLGNALARSGRVPEAIEQYQLALQLNSDYADAHTNLGIALVGSGRAPEAVEHYREALRLNPKLPEAHVGLGVQLFEAGQTQEAVDHFRKAIRLNPNSANARYSLGNALAATGPENIGKAIQLFEEALWLRPDYPEAHMNLGIALISSGPNNVGKAIEHYHEALRLRPDYPEALLNLGNALLSTGRIAEAVDLYQQALQLKPDYPEAHNNLGVALVQSGRIQEGIKHYEEALRLVPDYPNARMNLQAAQRTPLLQP